MSLNITITQTLASVQVNSAGAITKDSTGITWSINPSFYSASGKPLFCPLLRNIFEQNQFVSISDLNTQGQSLYSKNYDDCTIVEAKAVRHAALGNQWKTILKAESNDSPNAKRIELSDSDIDSLVAEILSQCIC
tara:strand:+ start:1117 stop:1521 length:405 start_codon:yes stop_codon:yes gene_type:complete